MPVCQLEKVNTPENTYDITFRIKNSAVCIYGNDISNSINKFKPTKEVAFAFNKEIVELIDKYKDYFNKITDEQLIMFLSKQISKKIIRSLFGSIIENKKVWCDSIEEMAEKYTYFYPDDKVEIISLSKIAKEGTTNKSEILVLINKFADKLKIFYKMDNRKI